MLIKKGQITKIYRNRYFIDMNHQNAFKLRGIVHFKNSALVPIVGDWVQYDSQTKMIVNSLPRKNSMLRPKVANIDQVLIIIALKDPKIDHLLITKTIMMVELQGIKPKLIFTKKDLIPSLSIEDVYLEYFKITTSKTSKENLTQIKTLLEGKLSVLIGKSGVGKSSLINSLFNQNLLTQSISSSLKSGKHTTRNVEIHQFKTIRIIDTPGFSKLYVPIDLQNISRAFLDFAELAKFCQFRNCLHFNEKNCAVKKEVNAKKISTVRYQNYCKIVTEMQENENNRPLNSRLN